MLILQSLSITIPIFSHLFKVNLLSYVLYLIHSQMKKSAIKYLLATLLLLIFGCSTFLPCFTENVGEQNRYSINKEKAEKEGQEKDYSNEKESEEYLSDYLILGPNDDHLVLTSIKFIDQGKPVLPSRILSVLSPPPDQV